MKPHFAASLAEQISRPVIVVCASSERAEGYAAASGDAVYIPKRALQLRASIARSREAEFVRISAISKLLSGRASVAFLCEEALSARLVPNSDFLQASRHIRKDDVIDPEALLRSLVLGGYERVSSVETQGQAARRGEVVDVFCPGKAAPYRIDFFDDIVESIHEFDPNTQRRSKSAADEAELLPAIEMVLGDDTAKKCADYFDVSRPADSALAVRFEEYAKSVRNDRFFEDIDNFAFAFCEDSLIEYLDEPIVLFDDYKHVKNTADERVADFDTKLYELIGNREAVADQKNLYMPMEELLRRAKLSDVLDYCGISKSKEVGAKSEVNVHSKNALSYNKHMELLKEDIETRTSNGWSVYLMCGSAEKADKLSAVLSDGELSVPRMESDLGRGQAGTYASRLLSGFELTTHKTYFLGENEIYGFAKKRKRAPVRKPLDIFTDLKTGDMIVHDVHGKGRFLGLTTRSVQGISRDYMELEYRGGDKLFIPTDQIDRVQKYMGGKDTERLSKLGGKEWGAAKARVKKAVKELAEDLVAIYSERIGKKGYEYSEDTIWQRQFEDTFPYEETDGQLKSIEEIKADMQQGKVMDRLLLGDVGYGKTEVAMRACFKAVMEGRQCAVLVPTTLLARQHYHSFLERFSDFAIEIESMSRFVSPKEQKRVIAGLKAGTVDVVIGTHRLLSKDIVYKDLGLLIIDEEQRFGVSHKERIKDIKRSVDVLTLSATPIPRTLQMSLTGIRDMSMIDTPPEDRKPPESYVMEYSGQLLHDAVSKEMERGGQTYFVCRQIGQMDKLAGDLRRHVPEARVAMAHGQL
ncbi:MAG: DEAD/DEAH box helicase, partial [Clostridia bacterium]|nr:DEAD/DEAH box helicase [Clostridia bacterium]